MKNIKTKNASKTRYPLLGKKAVPILATLFMITLLPVTVFLLKQQSTYQGHAAENSTGEALTYTVNGRQLTPPHAAVVVNGMPSIRGEVHGLGFISPTPYPYPTAAPKKIGADAQRIALASLPDSVDISQYVVPVGNQGPVESCVAWASNYTLLGWYAKRDNYYPLGGLNNTGSFSPMFTYAQIVKGQNVGTTPDSSFAIMKTQGIDTRADYVQGDYNYTDQPTLSEKTNAAKLRVPTYTSIIPGAGLTNQQVIETALASGSPVSTGFVVYNSIFNINSTNYYIDVPLATDVVAGGHNVVAFKYDKNGLWIENSWGTGWGLNGWAEISWAYVNKYMISGYTISPVSPTKAPTPTATKAPTPTPTKVPTPTLTKVPTKLPTPTPTKVPTPTLTKVPTKAPTPTVTKVPTKAPTPAVHALSRTGWLVTASSTQVGNSLQGAIDGNITTRWSTGKTQVSGQWFQVDMGKTQTISQLVMDAGPSIYDYPTYYQVYVSNNPSSWGSVIAQGNGSAVTTVKFNTYSVRYIKIVQTGTRSNYWSIHEFNVYGL